RRLWRARVRRGALVIEKVAAAIGRGVMEREQDQRWSALSRAALNPLQTDDRPSETFELTWRRDYRRRLLTLGAVLAIWTAGIEARLAFLQVIRHPAYLARAKDQQNRLEQLAP